MHASRKTALITGLCALGLIPVPAWAQPDDEVREAAQEAAAAIADRPGVEHTVRRAVRLGLGYLDNDSVRLGRFTGVNEEGWFLDMGFLLQGQDAQNSESARYWRLEGRNLGLDSRSLRLDAGDQGRYSSFFYYREIPNTLYRNLGTPYRGSGSGNLRLPEDGGREVADAFLTERTLGTSRQGLGAGGRVNLDTRWRASTAVHHERKDGTIIRGVNNNHFWTQERSSLVPVPVDYETTRFEADVTYDGDELQGRLGYQLSVFSQRDGRSLDVPDATRPDWSGAGDAVGTVSLEPDNQFHQVTGSLGYSFSDTGRVGADVALGRMTQDERFVEDVAGLPGSLNGRINTTLVNLRASGRPHPRVNLRAGYRYDDRDNRTNAYEYELDNRVVATRPVSYTQNRYHLDASYRVQDRTHLNLGVVRDERERTFSDRKDTDETAYRIGVRSRALPRTSLNVELGYAEQRGSQYERETGPEELRQYYLADRDRRTASAYASFHVTDRIQVTPRVQWIDDDYTRSELGLQQAERQVWAVDLSWVPTDRITTYGFYAYERTEARQAGREALAFADPRNWRSDRDDESVTLGVGGEYDLRPDRFTVGAEVLHVETSGRLRTLVEGGGGGVYPSLDSRLTQFSLYGDYRVNENLDFRLRYMVERYREKDWGVDGVGVTGVGNLILLDQDSPDYTTHLIAGALRYRF
ncbi:MtrB/PioB family decaheme-associated outer membrane protein [Ectothiorhodospira variabilis]|uniref:MtrB/PioB family decaheme-associated outer membrane protein n=1 Tax=Ectothiorhodospira variabilis TaxID=505694 RepID=UPI001EFBB03B|nr:MtrB/PioB family decaheme-associated outer membrane protein [Ectothiorhodospira variabilis]MCG5496487.1 MtrB/PioB family decaheme-associated outer membrane protein [Ectothiorhodospira variabilis]